MVPVFKNVGEKSTAKTYHPKVFEKLVSGRIIDHLERCDLFSDFSIVLGFLGQLQIFSQLYLK